MKHNNNLSALGFLFENNLNRKQNFCVQNDALTYESGMVINVSNRASLQRELRVHNHEQQYKPQKLELIVRLF